MRLNRRFLGGMQLSLSANEQPFKTNTNWELKKNSHVLCTSLFCIQAFKTTSNVLNSDVNIALIAFCSLAVTKLAHWPMWRLRRRNTRYQNPQKAKTNDNGSKRSAGQRPTREQRRRNTSYKNLQRVAQHCFVASFGSKFRVFYLA